MKKYSFLAVVFCLITVTSSVFADESIEDVFTDAKAYVDVRYHYEYVEQDGLAKDAEAATIRTRLGVQTGQFRGFSGVVEGENVSQITDTYNNTINGKTNRPVVADVENTQVNQAYLQYTGFEDTILKGGRQVITVDNHRFIGHVGWRQNNQVFDAFTATNTSVKDTTIKYGFIYNVNRIFGEKSPVGDFESKSHYYNISNTTTPLGMLTTYGYFLDFKNDSPANSSKTFGGSISGKKALCDVVDLKYYGEYARQSDYGDNTTDYDADYYHIAPALVFKGLTATLGYEVLGSDNGTASFRTPLATLHKFNGWADVFLTTPAAGLEDFYVDLTYKVANLEGAMSFFNGLLAKFQYHDFSAEEGGMDYGTEWGTSLKQPLGKNFWVEMKYADYDTDGFATDREKMTLSLGFKY